MMCENRFCVYWENNCCFLTEISLDVQGNCESCVYVELPEGLVHEKRIAARIRLELGQTEL